MKERLGILLVEDNPGDADLIEEMLSHAVKETYTLRCESRLSEAVRYLMENQVGLVLLDLNLPDSGGIDTVRAVRNAKNDVPIVVLTGNDDEDTGVSAVQAGAQDYLVKGIFQGKILQRVIQYAIERQKAKVRLQGSEQFLRSALDALSAHIAILDADGTILSVNKAWREFAEKNGASWNAVCEGVNYLDTCDKAQGEDTPEARAFASAIRHIIQGENRTFEMEYPCHSPNEKRWFHARLTPFPRQNGPRRMVVAHETITERVLAQMSLKESESAARKQRDFLNTLLETIPSPFFHKNLEYQYTGCNSAFERFIGISRSELTGKTAFDLFPQKFAQTYHLKDQELFKTGGIQHYEGQIPAMDGAIKEVLIDKAQISDDAGRPTGLIGIISDITERVKAEREKEQLVDQLRNAQKMEAIGTLAGGIAHDFNNILSAIIGFTDLAMEQAKPFPMLLEDLKEVAQAGLRAKNLVGQILAFSRQATTEVGPVQIHLLVKEVLKMLRATLPAFIEIREEIHSYGMIMADPGQVHQVIMNLCTNAFHAMRENGGILRVRLEERGSDRASIEGGPELPHGNYLCLSVADTGIGMDEATKQRIFDPYFTTKEKGEGTGLGLSVVYGIVKAHGGSITVEGAPGKGATFTLWFPKLEKMDPPGPQKTTTPLPMGSERILVVDDEPALIKMAKKMLEAIGYQVDTFGTGIDALAHFKEHPDRYDLVITDMTMPHMTGDQLAREILRIRPETPIIMCTGFSERIDPERAAAMGIRALTLKPLIFSELAELVRRVLNEKDEGTGDVSPRAES